MCGLNFILDKKSVMDSSSAIDKMNQLLVHRGPSVQQFLKLNSSLGNIWLGHTRLKIQDLSDAANQPFTLNNRQFLIFNGEIYNANHLREKYKFPIVKSYADTEVLYHFLQHNLDINELNGMFSFVFVDLDKDEILIARDRFGIKPLFFFENENFLIISSELKPLIGSGLFNQKIRNAAIYEVLTYKHVIKPLTIFEDVFEFEEGSFRKLSKINSLTGKFLQPIPNNKIKQKIDLAVVNDLLKTSVQCQMNADVPVALMLSGGVDSTLILKYLFDLGYENFPTFSVGAKGISTEYNQATLASNVFHSQHIHFEYTPNDIVDLIETKINYLDQPIADSAFFLQCFLNSKINHEFKVTLSGAGADEIFAGYNRHRAFYHFGKNPYAFKMLAFAGKKLSKNQDSKRLFDKLSKLPIKSRKDFAQFTKNNFYFDNVRTGDRQFSTSNFENALLQDQHHYLIEDVLSVTDRASMAYSMECRVPFLDNQLVDYLNQFSAGQRIVLGQKWILKNLLYEKADLKSPVKHGFGIPFSSWKEQNVFDFELKSSDPIFEYITYELYRNLLYSSDLDNYFSSNEVFSVFLLNKWLSSNF